MNLAKAHPIPLKLDEEVKSRLIRVAKRRKQSLHAFMCDAVVRQLEEEERQDEFYMEAMKSWEHYKETGLHVTGDEVMAWLDSWGTDNELEPPKCHL